MTSLKNASVTPADVLNMHAPWSRVKSKVLAVVLNTDPATLAAWRYRGVGPAPVSPSRRTPRYLISDVVRWLLRQVGIEATHEDVLRMYFVQQGLDDIETATDGQLRSLEESLSMTDWHRPPVA